MPAYLVGNATEPQGASTKVLCHCVNDAGGFGAGFVLSLRKWPSVEQAYRSWFRHKWSPLELPLSLDPDLDHTSSFALGAVQFVQVEDDLWVANIVGQHRTIRSGESTPIRYEALETGFGVVRAFCQKRQATAHMPRLGAGLARGSWSRIASIIDHTLVDHGIAATVYDLV
jgi:hypothetical protein